MVSGARLQPVWPVDEVRLATESDLMTFRLAKSKCYSVEPDTIEKTTKDLWFISPVPSLVSRVGCVLDRFYFMA